MGEKKLVISGLTLSYEGYFVVGDLYNLINTFTAEKGYDRNDVLNEVIVKEDGRYITLDLRPNKGMSDYIKFIIQTKINLDKITDEEIELDGKKLKVNKGKVKITFNGMIASDYEGNWMSSPFRVFMKVIFDKFVYGHHTKEMEGELKSDIMRLRNEINSFLNLNKYMQNSYTK